MNLRFGVMSVCNECVLSEWSQQVFNILHLGHNRRAWNFIHTKVCIVSVMMSHSDNAEKTFVFLAAQTREQIDLNIWSNGSSLASSWSCLHDNSRVETECKPFVEKQFANPLPLRDPPWLSSTCNQEQK